MAFIEQVSRRARQSKLFQDDARPRQFALDAFLAPLHYESTPDSGVFDAEVDCTPVRVNNAQFDGWRISANSWHYALGKDIANHGQEDGWVGFGGRRGQNFLKFRLARVGYLHWASKSWQDVGGAPSYVRSKLSSQVRPLVIATNGQSLNAESVATWTNVFTTPGSGSLDIEWRSNGGGLKEEIRINPAARSWIAANHPPSTPENETWFGFAFRLDTSDISQWRKNGVSQDPSGDFDDENGSARIELRDVNGKVLAVLPVDDAFVRDENGVELQNSRLRLHKRIYTDGGTIYLLVGARVDQLNALPVGTLVFDPTLDVNVSAGADDAHEKQDDVGFSSSATYLIMQSASASSESYDTGARFQNITIAPGSTISAATLELYCIVLGNTDDPYLDIYCENVDNAADFTTTADLVNRARTIASAAWQADDLGYNAYKTTADFASAVQEVINRAGWASGNALLVYLRGRIQASTKAFVAASYDNGSSVAPKLHITYTAAAAGWGQLLDSSRNRLVVT